MKNLFAMICLLLSACGQQAPEATQTVNYSLEQKFAIVSAGHKITDNDPTIDRARELLARASDQYGESTEMIADMSAKASNLAKENGAQVTPMEVLEASTLAYTKNDKFSDVAGMYITLRTKGTPHAEAMMASKGINKCLDGKC
jgi:hypothetical protein